MSLSICLCVVTLVVIAAAVLPLSPLHCSSFRLRLVLLMLLTAAGEKHAASDRGDKVVQHALLHKVALAHRVKPDAVAEFHEERR
ncbi:hypothetical protein DQ04_21411000 [Trypanosoma grayi]|uniref:hypothetical protein n=1 Tax=Trypanosoma grayi TaxID=71804 RepID=UPI0004F40E7F|nr:hypothetical protein DQ04_21411000 [Trypanosoma grayi]KEG05489.1 hypothetical protein DQ04_21411000 [Trypanosoma grayi]